MRGGLIALALMLATVSAGAAQDDTDDCGDDNFDVSIDACTAILRSKQAIPEWRLAAYFSRGLSYLDKGLQDRAIADFNSAIALKPKLETLANLHGGIAKAYLSKHSYAESIASSSKMIALQPGSSTGYRLRGYAYELSEQRDKAVADYRAALKLDPGAENLKQALVRLGAAP